MKAQTLTNLIRNTESLLRLLNHIAPDVQGNVADSDVNFIIGDVEEIISALGEAMPFDTKYNNPCLRKAAPTEPLFVTRAQDDTALGVVLSWMLLNPHIKSAGYKLKFDAAIKNMELIRAWQAQHQTKAAD